MPRNTKSDASPHRDRHGKHRSAGPPVPRFVVKAINQTRVGLENRRVPIALVTETSVVTPGSVTRAEVAALIRTATRIDPGDPNSDWTVDVPGLGIVRVDPARGSFAPLPLNMQLAYALGEFLNARGVAVRDWVNFRLDG